VSNPGGQILTNDCTTSSDPVRVEEIRPGDLLTFKPSVLEDALVLILGPCTRVQRDVGSWKYQDRVTCPILLILPDRSFVTSFDCDANAEIINFRWVARSGSL